MFSTLHTGRNVLPKGSFISSPQTRGRGLLETSDHLSQHAFSLKCLSEPSFKKHIKRHMSQPEGMKRYGFQILEVRRVGPLVSWPPQYIWAYPVFPNGLCFVFLCTDAVIGWCTVISVALGLQDCQHYRTGLENLGFLDFPEQNFCSGRAPPCGQSSLYWIKVYTKC